MALCPVLKARWGNGHQQDELPALLEPGGAVVDESRASGKRKMRESCIVSVQREGNQEKLRIGRKEKTGPAGPARAAS